MSRLPVSVVVNTYQAERYLDLVLQAVSGHVAEIVVCDMHSTDRTVEIAKQYGAKLVFHDQLGYADPARQFAVGQSSQPWVFILDADEVVPKTLWPEIAKLVDSGQYDVIAFHWLNVMFGQPMTGAGFGPERDVHPRLFKREKVTLHPVVHAYLQPDPGATAFTVPYTPETCIWHFTYLDAADFIARANKYTSLEAERDSLQLSPVKAVRKLVRDFAKRMVKQGGSKLGWQGFSIALLMLANDAMKFAKILERQNGATRQNVEAQHRNQAEKLL